MFIDAKIGKETRRGAPQRPNEASTEKYLRFKSIKARYTSKNIAIHLKVFKSRTEYQSNFHDIN